jgi:hypothetical protein
MLHHAQQQKNDTSSNEMSSSNVPVSASGIYRTDQIIINDTGQHKFIARQSQ